MSLQAELPIPVRPAPLSEEAVNEARAELETWLAAEGAARLKTESHFFVVDHFYFFMYASCIYGA